MSSFRKLLNLSRSAEAEDEALERLRRALKQDPRSLQFVLLADLYRRRGLYDESISVCLQGLQQHPSYVSGHVALARAYQEAGDLERAIYRFHRVIELAPENLAGHLGLADVYEQQGKLDEARQHLVVAMQLGANPDHLSARVERIEGVLSSRGEVFKQVSASAQAEMSGEFEDEKERLLRAKIAALESYRNWFRRADT